MKKLLLLLMLTAVSPPAYGADPAFPDGVSMDGRFGTSCPATSENEEICFVSLFRLIALPEQYHGKIISVIGFLVFPANEGHLLFPSSESFSGGSFSDAFWLAGRMNTPAGLREKARQGIWVQVDGRFDAKAQRGIAAAGMISDIRQIRESARMSEPSPPPSPVIKPALPDVTPPDIIVR